MNSCPWNVIDFNPKKISPLMHYICTTFAVLAMRVWSALPEKFSCAWEWPVFGIREIREYLSLSELLGNWDFGIIRTSITSCIRAVNFQSEEMNGFYTFPQETEILKHFLPLWSHLSIWDSLIIIWFVWYCGVYNVLLIIWTIYKVSLIYYYFDTF